MRAALPQARAAVYRLLSSRASEALSAGASVIADATFLDAQARNDVAAPAPPGAFLGFWLRAGQTLRLNRVAARHDDDSDVTVEVASAQKEPSMLGPGWVVLNAAGPPETLAEVAIGILDRGHSPGSESQA